MINNEMTDIQERIIGAMACSWEEETNPPRLRMTFPKCRTLPHDGEESAAFWMDETDVRSTIRVLQGALVKTGRKMQPPLTEEQIAWWIKKVE